MLPPPADRWAARYGFLRELWAGRSRVLADPAIEAALRAGKSLSPPLAALLGELVPHAAGAPQTWLLAHEGRSAGRGARGSTRVVEFDAFEDLLAEAPWQVAIVDMARLFTDAAALSRFAARAQGRLENRLETRAFRLLTALAEGADGGRVVVVSAPGEGAGGLTLPQFQELVTQHFGRARVYALAGVAAAQILDCGEVTGDDDDALPDDDDEGPVPLAFDNSLGEDPAFEAYLAVIGARGVPRGVTIVELPPRAVEPAPEPARPEPRPRAGEGDDEALRAQLAQTRRQLELSSIARQSLVEQLDAAQSRIDALEDQLGARPAAAERSAEAAVEPPAAAPEAPAVDERPDVAAAALLALRWELEQARTELRKATGRPVDAAERELAALRARLAAAEAAAPREALGVCAAAAEAIAARLGEPGLDLEAARRELGALADRLRSIAGDA